MSIGNARVLLCQPNQLAQLYANHSVLQQVSQCCVSNSLPVYFVGGLVRDALRFGECPNDLDVVLPTGQAERMSQLLAEKLHAKWICLDTQHHIYRVVLPNKQTMLDIADCVGPDIHTDLQRRDLTINAMAFDALHKQFIDPYDGLNDLQHGTIKILSVQNLLDDPLRLLRVFRFAAEQGEFCLDAETVLAVQAHANQLLRVAVERIQYEWLRLIGAPHCFDAIVALNESGLLNVLFPELMGMDSVPSNQYHHLPLRQHTLELLHQVEVLLPKLTEAQQAYFTEPISPTLNRLSIVRLACLFHDVGKPATMNYLPEVDKYQFHGHDAVSALITEGIAQRFKWGKHLTETVCLLIRWHLYPHDVIRPESTDKARRKFLRRLDQAVPEMLLLAMADRLSTMGPLVNPSEAQAQVDAWHVLWRQFEAEQATVKQCPQWLSGHDIMTALSMPPGPKIGQLLESLAEATLTGDITSKEDALRYLEHAVDKKP